MADDKCFRCGVEGDDVCCRVEVEKRNIVRCCFECFEAWNVVVHTVDEKVKLLKSNFTKAYFHKQFVPEQHETLINGYIATDNKMVIRRVSATQEYNTKIINDISEKLYEEGSL